MRLRFAALALALCVLVTLTANSRAADGNRLAYLDENNPWYPHTDFPKLTTPQWVGEEGVEAVVVLAIDDMRDTAKYEAYLRPILQRLKQIDGRAPVSIMTCNVKPDDPQLQSWLEEGLSIDVHTVDHPCPLLQGGDFAKAKSTYDRCIDLLHQIPGNKPVAFRMPCCDSLNTVSPRFFSEIFNKTTPEGNYLSISSSVFTVFTSDDKSIPRELVLNEDGSERFRRYFPKGLKRNGVEHNNFLNWIENYPYPYVINGKCWEFPCVVPSDWSAQFLQQPNNPKTLEDWKAALDITVLKQGVFNLVFHPHGWIKAEQVVELIDHAVEKHGKKVKFLTFREALDRLNDSALGGAPLRSDGKASSAPVLVDVNEDGYLDVLSARKDHSGGRVWNPQKRMWAQVDQTEFEFGDRNRLDPHLPDGARLVDLNSDGHRDLIISNAEMCRVGFWNEEASAWTDIILDQKVEASGSRRLPLIENEDGTDNGFFVQAGYLAWQNEHTDHLPDLVHKVSIDELVAEHRRREARRKLPPVPVGAAKIDITPDYPVRLSGYGSRTTESEGVAHRIQSRALAIGGDETTPLTVLLTVDTCGVPTEVNERVFEKIAAKTSLRREHFAISSTHSHSAPWLMGFAPNLFAEVPDEHRATMLRYENELVEKLVAAAEQAIEKQRPGRLSVAYGKVGFARNRRVLQNGQWTGFGVQEDGPVDHRLPVLAAHDTDGELICVLTTYACHCTSVGGNFNQISGDWAGFAADFIEEEHPDAVALISIGAGADANPEPRGTHEQSKQHGRELADEVLRLFPRWVALTYPPPTTPRAEPIDPRIVGRMARVDLPLGPLPTREEWEQRAKEGGTRGSHARRFLGMLDRGEEIPTTVPDYPVQTWCFGEDLAMVFLGGEVVVDYALRMNDTFDGDRLWINAYSNDVPCYISSKRVLQEGGYEADFSMIYYARPTRLAPETEDIIVDTVQKLLPQEFYSEETQQDFPAPKSPEDSAASIQVKPGLKVELVAAEPLITDPVAFDWDIQGRLWVVEMGDYPGGEESRSDGEGPKEKQSGRIRLLTDINGDGRYDEAVTFLDDIGFPSGICRWRNGVLVTAAPKIFYAEDTDGDGRADVRKTLYRGFGEGNQQHRVNGLRWGLDGWVHVGNGDSGGEIRSSVPDGESSGLGIHTPLNVSGRDLRIRPDTGEMEATSGQTQFGRARDDWGNWFGNNNSNPIWHYVLDEKYLRRNPHAPVSTTKAMIAVEPGAAPVFPISRTLARYNDFSRANRFTSACSTTIYRDNLLGEEFYGDAFVCEPVHNLVSRLVLKPNGVTFRAERSSSERDSEFFASSDNWTRPVMVRTGPDGALWVADIYRFVIEHPKWIPAEQQRKVNLYAGSDRGRIYRIVRESNTACCGAAESERQAENAPRGSGWFKKPWSEVSLEKLIERLGSRNGWWRDTAQRIVSQRIRGDRAPSQISPAPSATGDEVVSEESDRQIKAIWELALRHPLPQVRVQALYTATALAPQPTQLIDLLGDPHPEIRRQAAHLASLQGRSSASATRFKSRIYPSASEEADDARQAADRSRERFLEAYEKVLVALRKLSDDPEPRIQLELAYLQDGELLGEIAAHNSADPWISTVVLTSLTADNVEPVLTQVLQADTEAVSEEFLGRLFAQAVAFGKLDIVAERIAALIPDNPGTATLAAWRRATEMLGHLADFPAAQEELRRRSEIRTRISNAIATSLHTAATVENDVKLRSAAIEFAGNSGSLNDGQLDQLSGLIVPQSPFVIQAAAVSAIAGQSKEAAAGRLLTGWKRHSPAIRSQIIDALLSRRGWTDLLLTSLENETISAADLSVAQRERLKADRTWLIRIRAGNLLEDETSSSNRQEVVEANRAALELTADADHGRVVFEKRCSACHKIGELGKSIGADLTALKDRSGDALLTAILDPNRAVEAKFLSYIAVTKDGRSFSGMLLSETGNSLTLIGTDGKEQTLLRSDLDELVATNRSLMPEGLEKDLSAQDLADVIAFVQSSGVKWKSFPGNEPRLITAEDDGSVLLPANAAEIYGPSLILEEKYGNIGWWSSTDDYAVWTMETKSSGFYRVELEYACHDSTSGSPIRFSTGTRLLTARVPGTGTWDNYRTWSAGEIDLRRGRQQLNVSAPVKPPQALIDLKAIRLIPVE